MAKFVIVIGNGFNNLEKRLRFVDFITEQMKTYVATRMIIVETGAESVPKEEKLKSLLLKYESLSMGRTVLEMGNNSAITEELESARKNLEKIEMFNITIENEIIIFCGEAYASVVKLSAKKLFNGQIIVTKFSFKRDFKEKLKQLFIITPLGIFSFYFPNLKWVRNKYLTALN
ncbi:MAG: hypothetical protein Q7R98_02660 [Candidatus Jorgensenbacteria bacterium]|nr:hypothetical protein [Candidatus Jorgensenbacteria bacterium]